MPTENLEEIVGRFEKDWSQLDRQQIAEYFNRYRISIDIFLELVYTDLELRLKSGESARVEEYLETWPCLNRVAEELVFSELSVRERLEPYLKIDEFVDRFPGFESELLKYHFAARFENRKSQSNKSTARSYVTDRFSMESLHAEGGLGNVWRAHDHELDRTVALKEIKNKFANQPELEARFHLEAAITGRLDHPGVVPIHSKGKFRDGRPYYTMRMVQGKSLNERIKEFHQRFRPDKYQPEFRRLLQHFVDACKTLHFAHSRGVIHRDIKPANIMIGEYGESLVVDWGLAKIIDESLSEDATIKSMPKVSVGDAEATEAGQIFGSPAFMSPEQANGESEKVGIASDIYSLGATLYFLIANRPRVPDSTWRPIDEARELGISRQTKPLLSICGKAMAWQSSDRFISAREVAESIECFLDDSPVLTYRESKIETLERLVRRNQGVFRTVVIAIVLVATISTIAAFLIDAERKNANEQAYRAQKQREFADAARKDAVSAKDVSDELVELLSDIFILSGSANRGAEFDFANHVEKFERSLEGKEPEVRAKGRVTLGQYYASSRKFGDAIRNFEDALQIYQDLQMQGSADYLATLVRLAQTNILSNQNEKADALENQIVELASQVGSIDPGTLMELYSLRSQIAAWKNNYPASIEYAKKAQVLADDRLRDKFGNESLVTTWLILTNRLASQLIQAGGQENIQAADHYLRAAVETQEHFGHYETRAAITTLSNRGIWYRKVNRGHLYVANCRKVVDLRRRLFGGKDRETLQAESLLGSALLNHSNKVDRQEREQMVTEAVDLLENVLRAQIEKFGKNSSDASNTAAFLATGWRRQLLTDKNETGGLDEKMALLKGIVQANETRLEPDSLLLLRLQTQLALLYQAAGQIEDATQVFRDIHQSLKPSFERLDSESSMQFTPKMLEIMSSCAAHFVATGKYNEAVGMLVALVASDEQKGDTTPTRNYMLGLCWLCTNQSNSNERLEMAAERLGAACRGMAQDNRNRDSMPRVEFNANRAHIRALQILGEGNRAKENLDLAIASGRMSAKQVVALTTELTQIESQ